MIFLAIVGTLSQVINRLQWGLNSYYMWLRPDIFSGIMISIKRGSMTEQS